MSAQLPITREQQMIAYDATLTKEISPVRIRPRTALSTLGRESNTFWKERAGSGVEALRASVNATMNKFFRTSRPRSAILLHNEMEAARSQLVLGNQDELVSRDLLIADMQDEILRLQQNLQEQEERQRKAVESAENKNRALSERVREFEKQSAIFRSLIMSGQLKGVALEPFVETTTVSHPFRRVGSRSFEVFEQGCSESAVSISESGVDERTLMLHRSLSVFRPPGQGFNRIIPSRPNTHGGSTDVLTAIPNERKHKLSAMKSATESKNQSVQDLGHQSSFHAQNYVRPSTEASGEIAVEAHRKTSVSSITSMTPKNEIHKATHNDKIGWLDIFEQLLESADRENASSVSVQSEKKRRARVRKEVEKLLIGGAGNFNDVVDALDKRTRSDCLDEAAKMFKLLGILLKVMHSMQIMTQAGLDMTLCCETFQSEVKCLLSAQQVRLWLVDEANSQIWEWKPKEKHPMKRSLWASEQSAKSEGIVADSHESKAHKHHKRDTQRARKAGIAADVARTGVAINIPFPAVQSESFSIEIDRLPGENARTIICEPIKFDGNILAVVQCYNKMGKEGSFAGEEQAFSAVDEILLRLVAHHAGTLLNKSIHFHELSSNPAQMVKFLSLTHYYPCDSTDLFAIAMAQFNQVKDWVQAQQSCLYIADREQTKLWTIRQDGSRALMKFPYADGLVGWVAVNHQAIVLDEAYLDPRFEKATDAVYRCEEEGYVCKTFMAAPLINCDGTLLGVVAMLDKRSGSFTDSNLKILQLQAKQVMHCVQTNLADHHYFSHRETLVETLKRCKALVACDGALYFAVDKRRHVLTLTFNCGGIEDTTGTGNTSFEVPMADGLLGYVARRGLSICIPDAQLDPRFNRQWDKLLSCSATSLLCVPVIHPAANQDALGVVLLTNKVGSAAFSEVDRVIASILAKQMWKLQIRALTTAEPVPVPMSVRMLHNTAAVAKGISKFKKGRARARRNSIQNMLFNDE